MALPTHGTMAVDWEQRIDFDRLRRERLARAKDLLTKSEMGALLCFDMNNVRYLTATHIGTWAQDKANRFTLLPQNDEPILWDFGSAARHHQLHCPWLGERSRPGISMLRGAMSPEMGIAEDVAKKIKIEMLETPAGVNRRVWQAPTSFALYRLNVTDSLGRQQARVNAFVMVPANSVTDGRLNGYTIGRYPPRSHLVARLPSVFSWTRSSNCDSGPPSSAFFFFRQKLPC